MLSTLKRILAGLMLAAALAAGLFFWAVDANRYAWMADDLPTDQLPEDPDSALRLGIILAAVLIAQLAAAIVARLAGGRRTARVILLLAMLTSCLGTLRIALLPG